MQFVRWIHSSKLFLVDKLVTISSVVIVAAFITFTNLPALGQAASGTISGTATDASGAVISGANVALENTANHDKRVTVTNGSGFFSFAAVPPATYKVTVTANGFATWVGTDIIMHLGEDYVLSHIAIQVASTVASVQVVSSQAASIPLDNGASSTTINSQLVENLSIQGRDAAELVKLMPGMGMNTGLTQSQFNSQTTATNSGPIGQFSANGTQPYGSMQMTLDGASLVDVGNQGTQLANVNQDQTAEFTYLNAAFGADTPRGPTIIQITSKGGSQNFHGNAYVYYRNWQANSNESSYKAQNSTGGIGPARPMDHQVYPGGTIGGPASSFLAPTSIATATSSFSSQDSRR